MNVNASLFGQMITFAIFVWFTMKFVWPHIMRALEERSQRIADGLEAGERGKRSLVLAEQKSVDLLREAKSDGAKIIEEANHRANHIIEESKLTAREEGRRELSAAKAEIEQERRKAKDALVAKIADLVVAGTKHVVEGNIDIKTHDLMIDRLIEEI